MFRIAHLSDLHFKEKSYKRFVSGIGGVTLQGHCDIAKSQILKAFKALPNNDVDLLIVTGDVATSGYDGDLKLGKEFVDDLEACASIRRVVAIPGNHDRYQANGTSYFCPGSTRFEKYFKDHNPFDATLLADINVGGERLVAIGVDLSINPANNSFNVGPWHYFGRGVAYKDVLEKAEDLTNFLRNGDDDVYVVWACHFPPGAAFSLKLHEEHLLKQAAKRARINLALFGHTHETRIANMGASKVQAFVVSSALGYCFSRKNRELRSFSIIDIFSSSRGDKLASPVYYYWQETGSDPKDGTYQ